MKFEFEPIGQIKSVFKTRFGTPRQSLLVPGATAELRIRRDLQPENSLQGLSGFSHVWLIFVFHQNTNKITRPKIHPPRMDGDSIGIFATRSPHRPNPIGLSLAKLEKIEGDTVYLSGVDLVDGTPILDIKPYLKYVESQPDARQGWVDQVGGSPLPVEFYETFDRDVLALKPQLAAENLNELKDLITSVLERDPRPLVYKQGPKAGGTYKETHAIYLDDWNIFFRFDDGKITVTKIELA